MGQSVMSCNGLHGGERSGAAFLIGRTSCCWQQASQHAKVESIQYLNMSSSFKARYVWVASRRWTYPFQSSMVPGSGGLFVGGSLRALRCR